MTRLFGSYEGYVLQSNNQQEVTQLANNLRDTLSSRAIVIKSIPSWTITQIVQGVQSAKAKN
jgi:lipid II:glycine glycyltransferase (peptidoglycan interpeptide bridge formation enzyme)